MILVMTKMMMLLLMMMMMIMIMMIMIMMIMIMVIMIMIIIITIMVIRHVRSKMVGLSPNKENWPLLGRFASKQYDGGLWLGRGWNQACVIEDLPAMEGPDIPLTRVNNTMQYHM